MDERLDGDVPAGTRDWAETLPDEAVEREPAEEGKERAEQRGTVHDHLLPLVGLLDRHRHEDAGGENHDDLRGGLDPHVQIPTSLQDS